MVFSAKDLSLNREGAKDAKEVVFGWFVLILQEGSWLRDVHKKLRNHA